MFFIIANFGNSSIALIQWVIESRLENCTVLSVDTGWAATGWNQRVQKVSEWLTEHSLQWQLLKPVAPFADWIVDRREFPSAKYQWCAGLLKGVPINDWLEEHDPARQGIIVMAKRRSASRLNDNLSEWINDSEHYGGRKIWHPLYNYEDDVFNALVARTDIVHLTHRSLECEPCVRNTVRDFVRLDDASLQRVISLEKAIGKPMFNPSDFEQAQNIEQVKAHCASLPSLNRNDDVQEIFNMGCGSPWGCGE